MKKLLASLMALMCLTSMVACGSQESNEPEESSEVEVSEDDGIIISDVKQTGVLKVGVWGNSPTFSFHKLVDGQDTMAGFEIEFVKELAVRLGEELGREVTIEYTEGTLTGMFAALQAGQLHFICELAPTAERMESWQFTKPYHRSNLC
ncbi:MAG: transporter substrate-binding domain-containing protein, partial [Solobacterium sp.]|nr:transporter substrate-binding domain-containing protein [Solobacterium sp.]